MTPAQPLPALDERQVLEGKLARLTRFHAVSTHCSSAMLRSTSEADLFLELCRIAIDFGGLKMAWVGLVDEATGAVSPCAAWGDDTGYVSDLRITTDKADSLGQGPTGTAIARNRPVWCQDFLADPRTAPWHERAARAGIAASASLPLCCGGVPIGAFTLYSAQVDAFDEDIRELLVEVAGNIGFALDALASTAARRRAEAALAESEHLQRSIMGSLTDNVVVLDNEERITYINHASPGLSEQDVIGSHWLARIEPADRQLATDAIAAARATNAAQSVELRAIGAAQQMTWFELKFAPLNASKGGGIVLIASDISSRKQLESDRQEFFAEVVRTQAETNRMFALETQTRRAMLSVLEDQKRAEAATSVLSQRLQLATEAAAVGIWDWNLQTDEWIATPVYYTMLGWPVRNGAIKRTTRLARIHPEDREHVAELQRAVLAGSNEVYRYEARMLHADRSYRWIDVIGRTLDQDASGKPARMLGVKIDITQRKEAELALREAEAYRHAVFDQLAAGVFVFTPDRIVDVNAHGLQLVGYTLAELTELPVQRLLGQHERARMIEAISQPPTGVAQVDDWELVHRDGHPIVCEVTTRRLDAQRLVSIVRDVTARRAQELQLRLLSQAVAQSSESIVITDLEGRIEYANATALAQTGYSATELLGQNPRILHSGKTPPETYDEMWATLAAGEAWKGIFYNRRKDGSDYTEFAVISPVRGADGQLQRFIAVKEDVTEKKRMGEELDEYRHHLEQLVERRTEQLAQATRAAEAANEAKSSFLAAMSHEIRTPMNGVVGIVDVLSQSSLSPYQVDLTDTIRESAFALLGIIDDILDFSKIEAHRMTLELEPVDLLRLVEGACDALQPLAAARSVRMQMFVDPRLPACISSDPVRLRQILNNLLGNALKFSSGPERTGEVRLRAEPDANGRLRLRVSDNGIGMSAEAQARVFHAFEQAEVSTTRRFGGTGLGLTICRGLVALFEGTIEVQSAPGVGSTFTVTLPLQAAADAHDREPAIDLAGFDCHVALRDAQQASDWCAYLTAAGASAQAWPDAVALGNALVGLGGEGTVAIVDADAADAVLASLGPALPMVCVARGQRRNPRLAGPARAILDGDAVHRDALLGAVSLASGGPASEFGELAKTLPIGDVQAPHVEEAAAQGRLILVAEDNELNRKVIGRQLALLGLAAEMANDGLLALKCWREGRHEHRHAVLLTDLHMPGMDGYELTAAIRGDETPGQRLPIVALTANALHGEAGRCREAGMDDYLSKPVQLEKLAATLHRWLPDASAVASGEVPTAESAPEAASAAPPSTPDALPVFDRTVLAKLIGDEPAMLAEFRGDYLVAARTAAEELRAAAAAGDWAGVGALAHRLKSSSRSVGALALGECLSRLELAGKAGEAEEARSEMQRFEAALVLATVDLKAEQGQVITRGAAIGVLLVDDDALQMHLLQRQLSTLGVAPVKACRTGASALAWLQGRDTSAQLLLLDLNMPGMDGVEFMRHLARIGYAGALALVSSVERRVLETATRLAAAHNLNVLGHLQKPVTPEALGALVARWRDYMPASARRAERVYRPEELHRAIEGGELLLHFQPKVALADGALLGVEALVRWQHPVDGLVFPDSFIPLAETHGLIGALTHAVLGEALAQARRWRDGGLALTMAVNMSTENLTQLDFPGIVLDALGRYGGAASELVLEVTESHLMGNVRASMDVLTRLCLKQVRLSIDDFGTGYSSLAQLRDLPFDELKIDRGFVHGSHAQATQRAIFAASLEMAHQLGMIAVAEGVEDRADWDFVRASGCDVAQGYFIARPMPADELAPWAVLWRDRFEAL